MHAADDNHPPNGPKPALLFLTEALNGVPHADVNLLHRLHYTHRTRGASSSKSPLIYCLFTPRSPLSLSFPGFVRCWMRITQSSLNSVDFGWNLLIFSLRNSRPMTVRN